MWQFQKVLSLKSGDFGTLFSQKIPLYELALDLVFFIGGQMVKICPPPPKKIDN